MEKTTKEQKAQIKKAYNEQIKKLKLEFFEKIPKEIFNSSEKFNVYCSRIDLFEKDIYFGAETENANPNDIWSIFNFSINFDIVKNVGGIQNYISKETEEIDLKIKSLERQFRYSVKKLEIMKEVLNQVKENLNFITK